jgi:hypothetical protein
MQAQYVTMGWTYRDAACWVIDEHGCHQVNALWGEGWKHFLEVLRPPVRKLVPVSQLCHSWPGSFVRSAEQLEDVQQLLQLAVSREQGLLQRHYVSANKPWRGLAILCYWPRYQLSQRRGFVLRHCAALFVIPGLLLYAGLF